jgi:hypothetical protein
MQASQLTVLPAIALLLGLSSPAQAAAIEFVNGPVCRFTLVGEIEPGDADKLRALIESQQTALHNAAIEGRNIKVGPPALCLDSPGGSFSEGIALAEAVLATHHLETYIDAGAQCYSACALVFLAGSEAVEAERSSLRLMHVRGKLGLHAPFGASGEVSDPQAAANYFKAGLLAVKALMQALGQRLLPDSLRLEMLSHLGGEQDFFEIDTIDKAGRWNISLAGYRPPSSLTRRMVSQGCVNTNSWSEDGSSGEVHEDYTLKSDKTRDGTRRIVIEQGFAAEGMSDCIVTAATAGEKLYVDIGIGEAGDYEGYPGITPVWHMLPPETKLQDLPLGTGDDLSALAEAGGTADDALHKNVITNATGR